VCAINPHISSYIQEDEERDNLTVMQPLYAVNAEKAQREQMCDAGCRQFIIISIQDFFLTFISNQNYLDSISYS
jgi:hypothetical protein